MDTAKKSVNVTFRIDSSLKTQADELFNELGMSLSTAFNIFLRQSVREQKLPFTVTANKPNEVTRAAILDALNEKELHGPFDSVEKLMESLNA